MAVFAESIEDFTEASDKITEGVLGVSVSDAQAGHALMSAQSAEPAAGVPAVVESVTGEAKAAVDRVVAAVNAFNDATAASMEAANAVKTATQSKNFSAIKDARKKVEGAAEAVKKAKAEVTEAIDALKTAGAEAVAAVKAMGLDLSMFAESDAKTHNTVKTRRDSYFALKAYTVAGYGSYGLRGGYVVLKDNGEVHGFDVGFGFLSSENIGGFDFGSGYNYGRELRFDGNLQLLFGGSVGLWLGGKAEFDIDAVSGIWEQPYAKTDAYLDFIGPFAGVHWHSIEIMYRTLLGFSISGYQRKDGTAIGKPTVGFGARHQISIGYCFGKNQK
jgi:hypothetical protein